MNLRLNSIRKLWPITPGLLLMVPAVSRARFACSSTYRFPALNSLIGWAAFDLGVLPGTVEALSMAGFLIFALVLLAQGTFYFRDAVRRSKYFEIALCSFCLAIGVYTLRAFPATDGCGVCGPCYIEE